MCVCVSLMATTKFINLNIIPRRAEVNPFYHTKFRRKKERNGSQDWLKEWIGGMNIEHVFKMYNTNEH